MNNIIEIDSLKKENKKLEKGLYTALLKIDKAIEYIKEHSEELHHSFDEPDWNDLLYCNRDELLEILGDKENE